MTNEEPKSSGQLPEVASFAEQINPILADLFYPSESDEPLEPVSCYLKQAEPLTVSQVKDWLMLPPSMFVEEKPEAGFWAPVSTDEDWFGDEEKKRTARFGQLRQLLETELTGRQVFYVGESETDVYLLGRQITGERAGIKTKIVAT